MITHRLFLFRVGEVWFDEPVEKEVDILVCRHSRQPVPGSRFRDSHTLVLDLCRPVDELMLGLTKENRYEARRARDKDGIKCEFQRNVDTNVLDRFCLFFKRFAEQKKIPPANRLHLSRLAGQDNLDVSIARAPTGEELVFHAHYVGLRWARLLHSASLFREHEDSGYRNMVGRANRLLHFDDILRFKADGLKCYDFGGYYMGDEDKEKLRINEFKASFGGAVERIYQCERAVTLWGAVGLAAARLLGRR